MGAQTAAVSLAVALRQARAPPPPPPRDVFFVSFARTWRPQTRLMAMHRRGRVPAPGSVAMSWPGAGVIAVRIVPGGGGGFVWNEQTTVHGRVPRVCRFPASPKHHHSQRPLLMRRRVVRVSITPPPDQPRPPPAKKRCRRRPEPSRYQGDVSLAFSARLVFIHVLSLPSPRPRGRPPARFPLL